MVSSTGGSDKVVWFCGLDRVIELCSRFLVFSPPAQERKMVPAFFHFSGGRKGGGWGGGSIPLLFERHFRSESRFHTVMSP